jgi:glycosyltransferase involved in cell wall biosynthesis
MAIQETMSHVSVIIPVYKGAAFIALSIESVLAQSHLDLDLIIVNDGSPDNSVAVIQPYFADPRVKYIEQQNAGVAAARNTGIRAATGDYIALLDQDDLWLPDKLACQVEYLDKHPEIALVHSNIHFIGEAGERIPDPEWAWVAPTYGQVLPELVQWNRICTCTVLLRKSVLEQVGLFRQELAPADDWDLWLRVAARHPIGFVDAVTACYRVHQGNESRNLLKMQEAEIRVVETFIREHPGAVGDAITRAKLFSLYSEAALLLERAGRHAEARSYWLHAMRKNPVASKPYISLIWGALPANQRRALAWYGKRIRGLLAGKQRG